MAEYRWSFHVIARYKEAFILGTITTLELTILCLVFGTLVGGIFAILRLSKFAPFRFLAAIYVEVFRAIPLLVLLVWLYYCLPILLGFKLNNFMTALVAMIVNLSAFAAETIRAGIESIPRGHSEAALGLGMSKRQVLFRIILPQASKVMIPNMLGLFITMLKLSSLASVIAVYELLHSANNVISQTYRPLEIYTVIALIYLIIVLPVSLFARRLEKKIRLS